MRVHLTKSIGMLLLGVWLILVGLSGFVPQMAPAAPLLSVLAIVAGALILVGR